jgi:hypothetical protein
LLVSLIGFGFMLAQLQSPDLVMWTGRCEPATLRGGLGYYDVNGQTLAVNDPLTPASAPTTPVTVCYNPAHPEQAMVDHPLTRAFEAGLMATPFLVALIILAVGLLIRPFRYKDIDVEVPWPVRRR